jgi:lysophospholipase L1-like esterase
MLYTKLYRSIIDQFYFRASFTSLAKTFLFITLLFSALPLLASAGDDHCRKTGEEEKTWVGTWGTARQLVEPNNMPPNPGLSNNTLRQVVCASIGGKRIRLKFSNEFGKTALTINMVQIAASNGGSSINASTLTTLKFGGASAITIAPGAEITSDPLLFDLKPRMEVAITISYGDTPQNLTGHPGSRTTSFIMAGNQNPANADFKDAVGTDHWYTITGIEVECPKSAAAVIVFGDSITDGRGSGTNKQNRWPDILAVNLLHSNHKNPIGVLNMGIGGNAILRGGLGQTGLKRFEHDVLKQNGVRWLIIFEGVNDIGGTKDSITAFQVGRDLIDAYDQMINTAHGRGLKVFGATILPFKGSFYYNTYRDAVRNMVNEWIRNSGHFDAVIDFDKAIRDPTDTASMLVQAQSDRLHPNELGYKMLGDYVDLSLFK